MAEMHPILWTRLTDRRLSHPHVKVAVLSTFTNRSSDLADIPIVFKPGTDLAILNYIANHIISTGRVNKDFIEKHTSFVKGTVDIGYGLRPEHPAGERRPAPPAPGRRSPSTSTPIKFVKEYTLEKVSELSGVEAASCGTSRNSTPTRGARSCRYGPWGSTSMCVAFGRTNRL
jgi:nitrate reductase NapA